MFCLQKPSGFTAREMRHTDLQESVSTLRSLISGFLLHGMLHGSRCILDRLSAFLSEDIDSVLKGGAKVCQRQLVNVVRPLVTEFTRNLGREGATPIQRSFDASLLGRV